MSRDPVDPDGYKIIQDLKRGLIRGARTALGLVRIVLPLSILVSVLRDSGALAWAARLFAPFMKIFGLPGEAALAVLAGNVGNIYAGLAVIGPLGLTVKQMSVMGLMLGLSHSLILEAAVFHKMGAKPVSLSLYRFGLSLAGGFVLNLIMPG